MIKKHNNGLYSINLSLFSKSNLVLRELYLELSNYCDSYYIDALRNNYEIIELKKLLEISKLDTHYEILDYEDSFNIKIANYLSGIKKYPDPSLLNMIWESYQNPSFHFIRKSEIPLQELTKLRKSWFDMLKITKGVIIFKSAEINIMWLGVHDLFDKRVIDNALNKEMNN